MRKQAQMTMRCMQALVRVQARVRARRLQLSHENLEKAMELEEYEEEQRQHVRQGPTKPMSPMSCQRVKENDLRKHESAMKRERALAYAFNYQQVSDQI